MSHNTWIHRVARVTVVKPLVHTAVTPNQVTTARLLTGIVAALIIGAGSPLWQNVGAAVFVLSVVLDRADGDLARLTGRTSASGHRYDMIADAVSNALVLIGLGIGLRDGGFGLLSVPMGLVAGVSVATILWLVMRIEELEGARAAELPSVAGFDVDDAVLLIPVFIWLGQAEGMLVAAVFIAPLVAALFLATYRKKLRPSEPQ